MNIILKTLGKVVEEKGKATRKQLLDDTDALGSQLADNQTQTANLITNVDNAVIDGHAQTGRLITTMSNQLADTQLSRIKLH